jgi:hypothetical protein
MRSSHRNPLLSILLLYFGARTILACSCATNGSACDFLKGTEIVFVGRVTQDSGAGTGIGPAKMIVEEVFHGLPKSLHELTVDTSAGTSCYMRLKKDERYLIYGSAIPGSPTQVRRNACSFSFQVAGNETLLSALRSAETGTDARLIGKIQMKYEEYNVGGEGAVGVRVIATDGKTKIEAVTNSNGEFEFLQVPPGKYHLSIGSPNVFEDKWRFPAQDPTVPANSCGYQNLYVWPDGRIQGTVRGLDGKPLAGIPVQVFAKTKQGEMDSSALREQKSDEEGKYVLTGLPPGDFIVGVNGAKWDDKYPWAPRFYPGTNDRDTAQRLTLGRGGSQTGIDLEVGSPRTPAVLHIETVFEDGTPAISPAVNVENLAGVQRAFAMGREKKTNVLDVTVYMGETYRIVSHYFGSKPGQAEESDLRKRSSSWKGTSGPIQVSAPEIHVRVTVTEEKK